MCISSDWNLDSCEPLHRKIGILKGKIFKKQDAHNRDCISCYRLSENEENVSSFLRKNTSLARLYEALSCHLFFKYVFAWGNWLDSIKWYFPLFNFLRFKELYLKRMYLAQNLHFYWDNILKYKYSRDKWNIYKCLPSVDISQEY